MAHRRFVRAMSGMAFALLILALSGCEYSLTVTVEPGPEAGAVEVTPRRDAYAQGDKIELQARANEGWQFEKWGGDYAGTDEKITLYIQSDLDLKAQFRSVSEGEGELEPEGETGEGEGEAEESFAVRVITGATVTLTITPPAGAEVWGIEEIVPEGLTPQNIVGPNGTWDDENSRVYWYSYEPDPLTLSYELVGPDGRYTINGRFGVDGDIYDVTGDEALIIGEVAEGEGELPEGELPEGELPEGELPEGELPEGELPEGELPEGELPEGELPEGELPEGELPEGELPEGELPEGELPEGELPEGELPEGELPEGELPEGELPEGELPEGELPEGELPEGELPEGELPEGETEGEEEGESEIGKALSAYVDMEDGCYSYSQPQKLPYTYNGVTADVYTISQMRSQCWNPDDLVYEGSTWVHPVVIINPRVRLADTALLFIDGGSRTSTPTVESALAYIALLSGTPVVHVKNIPSQPMTFGDEVIVPGYEDNYFDTDFVLRSRSEDAAIAYSYDKFLEDYREDHEASAPWPLLFPMVKAAVKAMDTAQNVLANAGDPVDEFVVAGASKRGWTTWLTSAVDSRVKALAPIVINVLNMEKNLTHHRKSYGYWSPAIYDYAQKGIFEQLIPTSTAPELSEEAAALLELVDPYAYARAGLYQNKPIFMLNATGDEFFVPDTGADDDSQAVLAANGEVYQSFIPNVGHGMGGLENALDLTDSRSPGSMFLGWYMAVAQDQARPEFEYAFEEDGSIRVVVGAKAGESASVAATLSSEEKLQKAAPDLDVGEWIRGGPHTLGDGNIYVLEFFATWCPACAQAVSGLSFVQTNYGSYGVEVIGLSTEDASTVSSYSDTQGTAITYSLAVDDNYATFNAYDALYGIPGVPQAFLIDRYGEVVWYGDPRTTEFIQNLNALLEGEEEGESVEGEVEEGESGEGEYEDTTLLNAWMWYATSNGKRDFRNPVLGPEWQSVALNVVREGNHYSCSGRPKMPAPGDYTAFFIQLEFENTAQSLAGSPAPNLVFTTPVRVLPLDAEGNPAYPEFTWVDASNNRPDAVFFGEEKMPVTVVYGTPYEMGYHYGQALSDRIGQFLASYVRAEDLYSLDTVWPIVEAVMDPRILDEIEGIAEGSGVALDKLMAAHARALVQINAGFSNSAITPYRDMTGHDLVHAVTINAPKPLPVKGLEDEYWEEFLCMMLYVPETGVPHVTFTYTGLAFGFTGANIGGITVNPIPEFATEPGLAAAPLMRTLLYDSLSLTDALARLDAMPYQPQNMTLVLGDGRNEKRAIKIRFDASGMPAEMPRYDLAWTDFGLKKRGIIYDASTSAIRDYLAGLLHPRINTLTFKDVQTLAATVPTAAAGNNLLNVMYDFANNNFTVFVASAQNGQEAFRDYFDQAFIQLLLP